MMKRFGSSRVGKALMMVQVVLVKLLDDEEVRLKPSGQSTDDGADGASESLAEVSNKDHDRIASTHYVSTFTVHAHTRPIHESFHHTLTT